MLRVRTGGLLRNFGNHETGKNAHGLEALVTVKLFRMMAVVGSTADSTILRGRAKLSHRKSDNRGDLTAGDLTATATAQAVVLSTAATVEHRDMP
jgi:hypothetical protein